MPDRPYALLADAADDLLEQTVGSLPDWTVIRRRSCRETNTLLDQQAPALALLALNLPDGEALSLLSHPSLEGTRSIIAISEQPDRERDLAAITAGADFIIPRQAAKELLPEVLAELSAEWEEQSLHANQRGQTLDRFGELHGSSAAMQQLFRDLRKALPIDAGLFISGENGSGKDLAARSVHQLSQRCHGPFVRLSCNALNQARLEAELFGQAGNGDGRETRNGCLERASGGSLYIDCIAQVPADTQSRLLHVLESGRMQAAGEDRDIPVDLRLIVSSSQSAGELLASGQLREDLYLRIAAIEVQLPPLRERGDDVGRLAEYFVGEFNENYALAKTLSPDAAALLQSYSWPGNVRELRRTIEQAYIMADREITPLHLPDLQTEPDGSDNVLQLSIGDSVQDAEKKLTLATLSFYNGDKRRAAQTLGVSLKTLYNRINAYQGDKERNSRANGRREAGSP